VSTAAESRAEVAKLARVLGLEDVDYLLDVPAGELRDYREAVTDLMHDGDGAMLQRAASAARLLPPRTAARIAEGTLGSLISARLTGLLDPGRAGEVSRYLSIDFLAQLAAELDPRRAVQVVGATDPERVLEVALVMAAHEEYVAMGRFVGYLDDRTLAACIERLGDEEVLRVAFVMEGKERLERIVELVGLERTRRMLGAADLQGLGEEARDLLDHLSPGQRRRLSGQPAR